MFEVFFWAAVMTGPLGSGFGPEAGVNDKRPQGTKAGPTVYDFTVKDIDGKDVKLERFKGKVCLIVNTASQ
jgi:cytochrome oxidase Cu insertion factor (SCO1/SenC/PrrC family)